MVLLIDRTCCLRINGDVRDSTFHVAVHHSFFLLSRHGPDSMKRKRPSIQQPEEKALGASEFATILNGDDGSEILRVLRLFSKTVQRQRQQSLQRQSHNNSDGDDDDDDDETDSSSEEDDDDEEEEDGDEAVEEEEEQTLEKKKKKKREHKEDWMEDTKGYSVPFVGTSVVRGDRGTVLVGQWPTGLLEAYLAISPLAIELTSADLIPPTGPIHKRLLQQKHGRTSHAIRQAHLTALAQTITAAIPTPILVRDTNDDDRVVAEPPQASTNNRIVAKIMKDRLPGILKLLHQEGRLGKEKQVGAGSGGVGPLARRCLDILSHLAMTSVGTAREVVRGLDNVLGDGVLRTLLRQSPDTKEHYRVRSASLRLACALAETSDTTVMSYIVAAGSKERKVNPGILYCSLKYGMTNNLHGNYSTGDGAMENAGYQKALVRLLRVVQRVLLQPSGLSRRVLSDLLSGETLQNLAVTATNAPPLDDDRNTFQAVLKSEDTYTEPTLLEKVGIEARRILFVLLSDRDKSPFLVRITGRPDDKASSFHATAVAKAIVHCYEASPSLQTQNFVLVCLKRTPLLLPAVFRFISMPNQTQTFVFMSRLRFVARLLTEGPPVSACLQHQQLQQQQLNVLGALLPKDLKKPVLVKGLQSKNPLVVSELLKLIVAILSRFGTLDSNDTTSPLLVGRLPDLHAILSVRSRFDLGLPTGQFLMGTVCHVLDAYQEHLSLNDTKFDWVSLVPPETDKFCSASPLMQIRVLSTIQKAMAKGTQQRTSVASVKRLICVMLTTKRENIYKKSRALAMTVLRLFLQLSPSDREVESCFEYELSLWCDGACFGEVLDTFCSVVEEASKSSFEHTIMTAQAWRDARLPGQITTIAHTPLLTVALHKIQKFSKQFALLVYQVCAKCLVFHQQPRSLAAILAQQSPNGQQFESLQKFAQSLLSTVVSDAQSRRQNLQETLSALFSKDSFQSAVEPLETIVDAKVLDSVALARHYLHLLTVNPEVSPTHNASDVVNKMCTAVAMAFAKGGVEDREGETNLLAHLALVDYIEARRGLMARRDKTLLEIVWLSATSNRWDRHSLFSNENAKLLADHGASRRFLTTQRRYALLCLFAVRQWLSRDVDSTVARTLLQLNTSKSGMESVSWDLFLAWMESKKLGDLVPSDLIFNAWVVCKEQQTNSRNRERMIEYLANDLVNRPGGDTDENLLFAAIANYPPKNLIEACLQHEPNDGEQSVSVDRLLSTIVATDPIGAGAYLLQTVQKLHSGQAEAPGEPNVKMLWESGALDDAICAVVSCKTEDTGLGTLFQMVTSALVSCQSSKAVSPLMAHGRRPSIASKGVQQDVRRLDKLIAILRQWRSFQDRIPAELGPVLSWILGTKINADSTALDVMGLSLQVYRKEENDGGQSKLGSALLTTLLDGLPRAIKAAFKTESDETVRDARAMVSLAQSFIELSGGDSFVRNPAMDSIVRSCLRYGIGGLTGTHNRLASDCLRLARLLLEQGITGQDTSLSLPSRVLSMVLSHSKFAASLLGDGNQAMDGGDSHASKLELARLLLCCASLSKPQSSIDNNAAGIILTSYRAGMSEFDVVLRRFLHLVSMGEVSCCRMVSCRLLAFAKLCSQVEETPFLDELGGAVLRPTDHEISTWQTESEGWDGVVNNLDLGRIRSTLSQFPHSSTLIPAPIDHVETWLSQGGDSMDVDPTDEEVERNRSATAVQPREDANTWRGKGRDNRYDPGFVVPLIFGALQHVRYLEDNGESPTEMANAAIRPQAKEFALLTQRLCGSGALALTIATLGSHCSQLRGVAVATLCLFLEALSSAAGRAETSWRDRPQLLMLLESIQRCFVLRQAMHNNNVEEEEEESMDQVPKLPSLSAIFLAKSCLILSKPEDVMFGPINRYFLRLEQAHGAYNDFTRLPAFVSLFCGASDDSAQDQRERVWALQTLMDGFTDSYCYRMVASCHAPELILSAVSTQMALYPLDADKEKELQLLLGAITRLLTFGGHFAAHHLLVRVGLVSWCASLLSSGAPQTILQSNLCKNAFLRLALAAVERLQLVEDAQSDLVVYSEVWNLMEPLLLLVTEGEEENQSASKNNVDLVCQALCSSVETLSGLSSLETRKDEPTVGLSLDVVVKLLRQTSTEWKERTVWAVCNSPLRLWPESLGGVEQLCQQIFAWLTTTDRTIHEIGVAMSVVQRCVTKRTNLVWTNQVVEQFLSCRLVCSRAPQCWTLWKQCLLELSLHTMESPRMADIVNKVKQGLERRNEMQQ